MSIPGVLRGVIASSSLKPSDGLRAPNGLTTGEEIPDVNPDVPEFDRAEAFVSLLASEAVLLTKEPILFGSNLESVLSPTPPALIGFRFECVFQKDI